MRHLLYASLTLLVISVIAVRYANGAITFTPGHIYSSNYDSRTISEYQSDGSFLGSLTLPTTAGDEVHGLAFGADGLLYATVVRNTAAVVLALRSDGTIQQTYPFNVYVRGNLSYGKLAVDASSIYVGGQNSLTKFQIGDPTSAAVIYTNNQIYDVEIMPSGNLLVASAYYVQEITNNGGFVRDIAGGTDIRGIEFNPTTNKLFVTHLGYTGFFDRLMRFDVGTGTLESDTTFNYADDLFLTMSGELLVGSRTQVPRFYSQALVQGAAIGTNQQMFITQFVPEPGSALLLMAGLPFCVSRLVKPRLRFKSG